MKKILNTILAISLAYSCSHEPNAVPKEENPLFSTSRAVSLNKLSERINLEKLGIFNPTKVIKKDSLLIVLDLEGLNKISFYHERGQLLGSYLPTGYGDNKGLYILTMHLAPDGMLTAYDFGNDRLIEFDMSQFGQPGFGPAFIPVPREKKHLSVAKNGTVMVATGMFDEGRYALLRDGKEEYFLDYPNVPAHRDIDNTQKSILFASNITKIKPDGTKFVCANMQSGIIDLCSFTSNTTITRDSELNLYSPRATVKRSRRKPVAYSTDNLFGFCDIEVTDKYVYALYSGRSYRKYKEKINYGERIVVFDWEGNHVHTYLLGDPFVSISICEEENAVYGLTNHPNSVLIKYALD